MHQRGERQLQPQQVPHLATLEKSERRHRGDATFGRDRVLVIDVDFAEADGLAVLLAVTRVRQ